MAGGKPETMGSAMRRLLNRGRRAVCGPQLDFGHFPGLIGCAGRGTSDRSRGCRGRPQAGVSDAQDYRRFASARERLTSRTARSDRCSEWDAAARWAPGDEDRAPAEHLTQVRKGRLDVAFIVEPTDIQIVKPYSFGMSAFL